MKTTRQPDQRRAHAGDRIVMPTQPRQPTFRTELVPTWAKVAAWSVPLITVPSIVWRFVTVIDNVFVTGDEPCGTGGIWEQIYVLAVLPSVQLGLALLTIGLVRPWGEVFPRWIPALGGRRVPVSLAVSVAVTGALVIAAICLQTVFVPPVPQEDLPPGCRLLGWDTLRWYLPMVLWPPLLLAVTWHYRQRRRCEEARTPSPVGSPGETPLDE
ncbi:hypothetical protein [Actinomadura sp. 3N407]|uniref:hypothetical protein n=1 Tax=Actinomadura sp. 3N407 TaxID=3457423 RepID=UPI003FCD7E5B